MISAAAFDMIEIMDHYSKPYIVFIHAWNRATLDLEYNPEWGEINSSGLNDYNALLVGEDIGIGTVARTIDPTTGIKLLIVGTRYGNIVIFMSKPNMDETRATFSCIYPTVYAIFKKIIPATGIVGSPVMVNVTGGHTPSNNIGFWIEQVFNEN